MLYELLVVHVQCVYCCTDNGIDEFLLEKMNAVYRSTFTSWRKSATRKRRICLCLATASNVQLHTDRKQTYWRDI